MEGQTPSLLWALQGSFVALCVCLYGQGKPLPGPATMAEPQGDMVSKGQAVCTRMGRKLQGLGHSGTGSALSLGMNAGFPHIHIFVCLSFQQEKGHCGCTGFCSSSSSLLSPSSSSSGKGPLWTSLLAPSGPPTISFSHTHAQDLFWRITLIDLHLMHKHVWIPGRQFLSQADVSRC